MSIHGYAEAIKEGIIPKDEKEKGLEIIIKESGRMKALVDEFIYLSKMETLNESYNFEPVALDEAVKEAIYAVKSLALEKEVSIETSIASGNNVIDGDPEKIHRLLLNILSNALHYGRKNVIVILNNTEIVVEDDGPGFDSEDLEKVFDPFFHKHKKESSGLGLAISRAIVEKHGGTITVKNKPGDGAKILINFPPKETSKQN